MGKTALLREACHWVAGDLDVLWAACLPPTSLAVPCLPLTSALGMGRAGCAGTGTGARGRGRRPTAVWWSFDTWLDGTCRRRAVLLVVDHLHWADQSSLDVLMYVVAGPARRRLAVVATVRAGEVGAEHRLRRWLATSAGCPG